MSFIQVKWKHSFPNTPVLLSSELDADRRETRKVEEFADGCRGYASATEIFGDTRLGSEPIPALSEIARDPQFEPTEMSREEFERIWAERFGRSL